MANNRNDYQSAVDTFLWKSLYQDMRGCTEDEAECVFSETWGADFNKQSLHDDLREKYSQYIKDDSKAAYAFLESHPQMQDVHGEWRRMQQGYSPVSSYDLNSELEAARYLSQYDPDLSLSEVTTLFPEEIHKLNAESFRDVCRRYGREYFQEGNLYNTGNAIVDEMFSVYDEEAYEDAARRYMELEEELGINDDESDIDFKWASFDDEVFDI